MANDVTAVFGGDIGPMEKAMAQLRAAMKATAANATKDLTFKPRIDDTALKAATAQIAAHMKQMQTGAAFRPALPPPAPPPRDLSASDAYLDRVYAGLPQQHQAMRRGGMAFRGGSNSQWAMGNAAMQVQDIAVQLQMGTRMSTILAQQGSQLASAFGPRGMLLGAGAAIAGVLMTVGTNAKTAFDAMIKGAADSHKEIDRLLKSGGVKELSAAMGQLKTQEEAFAAQRAKNSSLGGVIAGGLGMIMGGKSKAAQEGEMIIAEGKAFWDRQEMARKVKEASAEELKIAQLRSKGYDEEADAMERKVALARTLAEIEASAWSEKTKAELKRNATAMSEAAAQTKANERARQEAEQQRKRNEELRRSISEHRAGLAGDRLSDLTGVDRLQALERLQTERRNDAVLGGLTLSETGIAEMLKRGDLGRADQSLKALREYEATQREIEGLTKSMREAGADEAREKSEKAAAVQSAREEFALELQISQAIAAGGVKESAKSKELEDQLATLRLQKQLMDQFNLSAEKALALAKEKVATDNAATEAVKKQQQQQALDDIKTTAAIPRARVRGHTRKAERMESQAGEDAKTRDLIERAGLPEDEAREMARQMQRDEDKLAGRATRIRSKGQFVDNWGIDAARFPGLDAMKAQQGKSLRDEWQFPGLDAMAKKQAAANAERAKSGNASSTDSLLEAAVKALTAIERKLDIVN